MRLNGSATIEASVLIPVFTVIIVQLILLALNCHDNVIINCAADKGCMRYEFEKPLAKEKDTKSSDRLSKEISEYISVKTMVKKPQVRIKSGLLKTETEYSRITANNPVEYVWQTDAVKKLISAGGDE